MRILQVSINGCTNVPVNRGWLFLPGNSRAVRCKCFFKIDSLSEIKLFIYPRLPLGYIDVGGIRIFEFIKTDFFQKLEPILMDAATFMKAAHITEKLGQPCYFLYS